MRRLLVVHHSPSASTRSLLEAVLAGTRDEALLEDGAPPVDVVVREALEATADDVLAADGYLLGTSVNFGYMSGALKHFFDSVFLQVGGALDPSGAATEASGSTAGRPYGLWAHGRYDTTGGIRSVRSIVGALGWRPAYDVLDVCGDVDEATRAAAHELGATLVAVVAAAVVGRGE